MKGRKRQSPSTSAAKGNPGKRARSKSRAANAPKTAVAKVTAKPSAPTVEGKPADLAATGKVPGGIPRELTKHGQAVWNMVAPQLLKSKLLHPGREWAWRDPNMANARPPDRIIADLRVHFANEPVYADLDQILREFVEELRQI